MNAERAQNLASNRFNPRDPPNTMKDAVRASDYFHLDSDVVPQVAGMYTVMLCGQRRSAVPTCGIIVACHEESGSEPVALLCGQAGPARNPIGCLGVCGAVMAPVEAWAARPVAVFGPLTRREPL